MTAPGRGVPRLEVRADEALDRRPNLWLHLAAFPAPSNAGVAAVVAAAGLRRRAWHGQDDQARLGNFAGSVFLSVGELEALAARLDGLGATFALHRLTGPGLGLDPDRWQEGWRVVHVPGVGTASGPADSAGRFLVNAEELAEAVSTHGDGPGLADAVRRLAHLDLAACFERRWAHAEG